MNFFLIGENFYDLGYIEIFFKVFFYIIQWIRFFFALNSIVKMWNKWKWKWRESGKFRGVTWIKYFSAKVLDRLASIFWNVLLPVLLDHIVLHLDYTKIYRIDYLFVFLAGNLFVFRWKGQWILLTARNQLSPRYFDILLLAFSYHNRHQRLAFSLSLGGD